jgi:hypothetical protein
MEGVSAVSAVAKPFPEEWRSGSRSIAALSALTVLTTRLLSEVVDFVLRPALFAA